MDHFQRLKSQTSQRLTILAFIIGMAGFGVYATCYWILGLSALVSSIIWVVFTLLIGTISAQLVSKMLLQPLEFVWRASIHMDPNNTNVKPPDMTKLKIGNDVVSNIITMLYRYASQQDSEDLAKHRAEIIQASNVVSRMPIPLFVFNKEQSVTNASNTALKYLGLDSVQLFGKKLYEAVNLEFPSEDTLEKWIISCQNKINDLAYWQRARVVLADGSQRLCDIAAEYKKDSPSGAEYIVTIFDRTEHYTKDDQDLAFVALAVHELRTPLTMLRGYIEVFDDELTQKLDDELLGFLTKMKVSAQQLNVFFNNILNVARIEQNQLTLKLSEANWSEILQRTCEELQIRVKTHGRTMLVSVADGLPTAGVDPVSIIEVINNLIDNAIKYSPEGGHITVNCQLDSSGMIETTVHDDGAGIAASAMPNLFSKFYRSHRSATSVGGTGLGLYLCKAIIDAHEGQIWVKSKEGEGSTFGFTLLPYSQLAEVQKKTDNETGIIRHAHGWIKNHTLNRQ